MLKDFDEGRADLYLSLCILNWITCKQFDSTFALLEESTIWIVPKAKKIQDWRLLAMTFTPKLWVSIVIVLIVSLFAFTTLAVRSADQQFKNVSASIFFAYSTILNTGYTILPRSFKLRLMFACLVVFSLNINAYLQGQLYSNLSHPIFEKKIAITEELLESGLPLMLNPAISLLFLFNGPVNKRIFDTYIQTNFTDSVSDLMAVAENQNFATVISGGVFYTFPHMKPLVDYFDIVRYPTVIFVKRYHVLFETINNLTKKFVENGLVKKFASDLRFTYSLECWKYGNCTVPGENSVKLSYKSLEGAFFIYAVGVSVACTAFTFEICIGYLKSKRWFINVCT